MKRFALISMSLAVILAASAATTARGETIVTHRYDFENNANDSVGTLNGTTSTEPNVVSYVGSSKSGSYSLLTSSAGGWVDVPSYNFGNQFSIAAWIKPLDLTQAPNTQVIASNCAGGVGNGFRFFYNGWNDNEADHKLLLELGNGTTGNALITNTSVITVGSWNYVVATLDKTNNSYKLYVNGDEKASGSLGINFQTNSAWRIGTFINSDGYPAIKGGLDDVQVYSGVLSGEQVDYLYDHPGAAIPEPTAMVLFGMGAVSLLAYAWRKRKSA